MSRWYLKRGDGEVGPGSDEQIRAAFKKGALQLSSLVRREDKQEWVSLQDSGILPQEDVNPFMAGQSQNELGGSAPLNKGAQPQVSRPIIHKDMFKEKPRFGRRSQPQFASFSDRFIALMIDVAVLWLASTIVSIVVGPLVYYSRGLFFAAITFSYLVQIGISVGYFVLLQHEWGYTLGRKVMKIHVEMEDRSKPGMQALIVRSLGQMLSGFILFIGYFLALSDPKMRTLHDKLAGTIVVKD